MAGPYPGNQIVLVVAGEPDTARKAEGALHAEGYRVETASTGEEMREKVERLRPTLVLLDEAAPGVNARELCRWLGQIGGIAVIVTGRGDHDERVASLDLGADDYLSQPFNPTELAARVRAVLRRYQPRGQRPRVSRLGDLTVDHNGREVRIGDRLIDLRRQEFDLLATLAANPDTAFERERLLRLAWGYEEYVDSRTVDVHVNWLREKLASSRARIQTVWGVGYKLVLTSEPTADNSPGQSSGSIPRSEATCGSR